MIYDIDGKLTGIPRNQVFNNEEVAQGSP